MLSVGVLYDLRLQEDHIYGEDKIKATLVTEIIKNGLITMMIEGRSDELKNFIQTLIAEDLGPVRLHAPDGRIIASSVPSETGGKAVLIESYAPSLSIDRNSGGSSSYNIQIPFFNEKPCQTCHQKEKGILSVLSVSMSMDKTFKRMRDLRKRALFYFILMLAASSAVVSLVTGRLVIRPLRGLKAAMKEVERGDLNARYPEKRNDELGDLGSGLNSMLDEVGKLSGELEKCHVEAMHKVEKMATIGELAGAIAHEIKNPLAGISGAIQVLVEDFPPEDPRREIISEVQNEIERLDKAIRDLLSYAKPPAPHIIETPVDTIIDRSVRLVQTQARKQGVAVNVISINGPVTVHVDPDQIQQVFLNVMLNALHTMPGGGDLVITTHQRAGEAEVSIRDTGPGISKDNVTNIFKPFYTTKHTGTGLGLAISKNIMESHGGRILVESTVGAGSNFRIILPMRGNDG